MTLRDGGARDHRGYGPRPPPADWPGGARLALQFVLNYEEGGERSILNGDACSEDFMTEVPIGAARQGRRHPTSESLYDYGSRAGFWRILRLFGQHGLPLTVYAVGRALELNPEAGAALRAAGHEVAAHGYRWIDYSAVPEEIEREHIRLNVAAIEKATGTRPVGWFTGRTSENTRRLVVEEGGFLYDSDAYDDDLPYWVGVGGRAHLVIPYAFDTNDMKYSVSPGAFNSNDDLLSYLRDAFDVLYGEGATTPGMMSVGLHGRVIGRPGRSMVLQRFLDYVSRFPDVWICRRVEIAEHWRRRHPAPPA